MVLEIEKLCEILNAQYFGSSEKEIYIRDISIDSRSLHNTEDVLFFAIKGHHHNAHQFIAELINRGVRYFVVEQPMSVLPNGNFFVVQNTKEALQKLAIYHRAQFRIPMIGITGSYGKTIVKEWLGYLLQSFYEVGKNPKSYNSQIGVPLSILALSEKHTLGIFEAGISLPTEMECLEKIIRPTIGVLTTMGVAHHEGFDDMQHKVCEKLKLFNDCHILVCEYNNMVEDNAKCPIFSWSFDTSLPANVLFQQQGDTLLVRAQQRDFRVQIPFTDHASVLNIASCISVLLAMEIPVEFIQTHIAQLHKVEMRLQVLKGIQNCTIIDDSYISDYQSLRMALDFLEQQNSNKPKTVILSDVQPNGFSAEKLYNEIENLLNHNNIHRVIGIGESISKYLANTPNFHSFPNTEVFLKDFNLKTLRDEIILIKGSRLFSFEKIVAELTEKTHETVLEINLDAISHNLNVYKSKLRPSTKVMAMVKAFGYGNGGYEIVKHLEFHKVDYIGVAFADEGVELRKLGVNIPIVVMNPEYSAFETMISYGLEPEIYSLEELQCFLNILQEKHLYHYPVHIKLNTGMNRLGFVKDDFEGLKNILTSVSNLKIMSIFSHLATSDMPEEKEFTLWQIQRFDQWSQEIISWLSYRPILHILNTSGIFHYAEYQYDMVRIGIGLYGVGNSAIETQQLHTVATLKTTLLQINKVKKGDTVGYGRNFVAQRDSMIATIPIGYADGIRRCYGNGKGNVWLNNQKIPIVGNICMDMMMIDVTNTQAKIGDEVEIFGKNLPIIEIANIWQTIPYEVMTSVSHRVKRIFYKE